MLFYFFFYLFYLTPSAIEDLIIFDVVLHYYGTASPYFLLACILLGCRPVPDRQRCEEPTRPTRVNREPTTKTEFSCWKKKVRALNCFTIISLLLYFNQMNGGIGCIKENIVQTQKKISFFFLPVKKSYKSNYIV